MNALAPLLCASPCTVAHLQHRYEGRLCTQPGGVRVCHSSQELFALLRDFPCSNVWILDPVDIEPINVAARVKQEYHDVRVSLVAQQLGGSLRSRAYAANIDALWDYTLLFKHLDALVTGDSASESRAPYQSARSALHNENACQQHSFVCGNVQEHAMEKTPQTIASTSTSVQEYPMDSAFQAPAFDGCPVYEDSMESAWSSYQNSNDSDAYDCNDASLVHAMPSFPEHFYCPDEESVAERFSAPLRAQRDAAQYVPVANMPPELNMLMHEAPQFTPASAQPTSPQPASAQPANMQPASVHPTSAPSASTQPASVQPANMQQAKESSPRVSHASALPASSVPMQQASHSMPACSQTDAHDVHFSGNVIALLSGTGGAGKSTLAALLALQAARSGKRCVLLDASLQFADCAPLLGIEHPTTYASMLQVLGIPDPVQNSGSAQCTDVSSSLPARASVQHFPFMFAAAHDMSLASSGAALTSCTSTASPATTAAHVTNAADATDATRTANAFAQHMQHLVRSRLPLCVSLGASLEYAERYEPVLPVLIEALSEAFDVVVVNTSSYWSDLHALLLEKAAQPLMLIDQRVQSLNAACQVVDLCTRCGIPTHSIRYVLNKYTRKGPVSLERARHALGDVTLHSVKYGGADVETKLLASSGAAALENKNPLWYGLKELACDIMPSQPQRCASLGAGGFNALEGRG